MTKYTAAIAGATGAAASRLVELLLADDDWSVIGICRNPPAHSGPRLRYVSADLMSPRALQDAMQGCGSVTHLVYSSRAPFAEGGVEDVAANVAMFGNVLDVVENTADALQHVHLVTGAKWYGIHLGSADAPSREDAPRHLPPNFYYNQQDLLSARQQASGNKAWSWSASRPNLIYDFAPARSRNIVSVLGAWAAIHKELGLPLNFPGSSDTWNALYDMVDATQLAGAIKWIMTSSAAENEAFNVTDGDFFRWKQLWKRLALHFDMELGEVRPMQVEQWMADKQPIWDDIVARHQLTQPDLAQVAPWGFLDYVLKHAYDVVTITTKIRQAGFTATLRTDEQVIEHLQRYQQARILPQ